MKKVIDDYFLRKVIQPLWKKRLMWIAGCLLLASLGAFLIITGAHTETDRDNIFAGFILLLACGFLILILALGGPKIVLTPGYLSLVVRPVGSRQWSWKDVGPFYAGEQVLRFRDSMRETRVYWACAFSDQHHDLMATKGELEPATPFTADINLPLSLLPPGESLEAAEDFARELNRWRVRFGDPAIETAGDQEDGSELLEELKTRHRRSMAYMAGGLVCLIAVLSLDKEIGAWLYLVFKTIGSFFGS